MKYDLLNDESNNSKRIITPLEPKRVPSVVPGLEGLAAMVPDTCETAPETMAPVPELVVSAAEALTAGQLPETQIAFSAIGGDDWGQFSFHEAVALPPANGDAAISHDTNFDGNVLTISKAVAINSAGIGSTMYIDFSDVIEIGSVGLDCHESEDPKALLSDYKAFLAGTPGWVEKFSQPSQYVGDLVFGTSEEATNFDNWFIEEVSADGVQDHHDPKTLLTQFKRYAAQNDLHDHLLESSWFEDLDFRTPAETLAFDSWYEDYHYNADVIADYKAFLDDTPGWVEKFSQPSAYFGDLIFGTYGEAIDFDNWFIEEVSPDGVQNHHNPQALLAQFKTYAAQNDLHDYLLVDSYLGIDFRTPAEATAFDWWYCGFYEYEDVMSQYKAFLADTPGWVEQFSQPSAYFGDLIFGTSEEATDFDAWFIEEVSPDGVQNHHNPQTLLAQFKTYAAQNDFYGSLTMSNHDPDLDFRTPAEALAFDAWYEKFEKPEDITQMSGDTGQGSSSIGNLSAMSFSYIDSDGDQVRVTALGTNVTYDIGLFAGANNLDLANISAEGNSSLSVRLSSNLDGANDNEVILELGDDGPTSDQIDSKTLAISNVSDINLQSGEVVSGRNVYGFNPDAPHANIWIHPEASASVLSFEIAPDNAPGFAETRTSGDVDAALESTRGAALIVEFGVLSPSKQLQSHSTQTCAHPIVGTDVPHFAAVGGDLHHDISALSDFAPDAAQLFAAGQLDDLRAALITHKIDMSSAAAAAVATGTVLQAGFVDPSARRPQLKI